MITHISQLTLELLQVFWLLLPASALVKLLKSRRFKGFMGEVRVNRAIRRHLDRRVYHAFSNVTLPSNNGTTQIDHVLISPYGIFVLETKNMQGLISGSKQERSWTQQIDSHVCSFQNPLHQNYKHTKALHELLGVSEAHIFSLIVFVGNGTFATEMPENVVQGSNVIQLIKARNKRVFNAAKIEAILSALKTAQLKNNFSTRRKHIRHVQSLVKDKAEQAQLCPLCGRPMVLRAAKQGKNAGRAFWGCSAFPHCSGTRNAARDRI
ncbi:NERD domain-containing protein [Candidatus Electronema sp. PJ]|uniref:nuclease-related domain-containing protein n=1 Tax=Candidatus Electronema sp. PJ TaxID=3401572 RepID=UPI003AA82826